MDASKFLEIENRYNLIGNRIDGIDLWEISRNTIWQNEVCSKKLNLGTAHRTHRFDNIKHKSIYYFFHGMNLPKTGNRPVLFINHPRRVKVGDYYDCIYTEELSGKYDSIVMEGTEDGFHYCPVRTKNLVYYDSVLYFAQRSCDRNIKRRSVKYRSVKKKIREQFEDPLKEIISGYNLETDVEDLYEYLTKEYFKYRYIRKQAESIITRIKPAMIVEVCYYSPFCMAMNEAARKLGVITAELQHGVMVEEHIAYQYGSDVLVKQLPDYMFLFSDYWKTVANVPDKSTKLVVTGYPYYEEQLEKYKHDEKKQSDGKSIIFISQGTIGKELSKLATEVADILIPDGYRIIYKLHPGEYVGWKEYYPWLFECDKIETVDNSEKGIYDYFSTCDIQIGVYSTAIYEGIGFGLSTYIYNVGRANIMESLSDQGYVQMFNSAKELIRLIKQNGSHTVSKREFWKKDAMDNIVYIMDELLKV